MLELLQGLWVCIVNKWKRFNGYPDRVVIDKSGANLAGLENMNGLLILNRWLRLIEVLQVKYLNDLVGI